MNNCSYLIMAGGTGGHVFPALALAKELLAQGAEVHWLGTDRGMESTIVPAENISLKTIYIKGFRGKSLLLKLAMPFLLCWAILQAISVIRAVKPSVVVGFGGFVAAPGGIAARLLRKKLIIHEQNSIAGTTNRWLAKIAHKRLEAFPNSLPKATRVGNPVRHELINLHKHSVVKPKLHVLVMGGSLGAKAINDIVPSAFALIDSVSCPDIWHQTGKEKSQPVLESYQSLGIAARVEEFIEDIAEAYLWADIVVCRAGALTVSEITVVGLPAIFIPLPTAIDNHQFFNAKWLDDSRAAIMIEQKQLTKERLSEQLMVFISQPESLARMGEKARSLALPNAVEKTADICKELCHAC